MVLPTDSSWKKALSNYFMSKEWLELSAFIDAEYASHIIFPQKEDVFRALELCPLSKTKVVILGQDPYHGAGQAHGLSFSIPDGMKTPPSLRNILQELRSDLGKDQSSQDLTDWAKQGVLLLNSVLTVREASPASHASKGWEDFTDMIIKTVSDNNEHVVFILWGAYAQKKTSLIDTEKHLVLTAPHPSPLSSYRGFFGSKPFSKTNTYLAHRKKAPVEW